MSASKYTWKIYATHFVAISVLVLMMISLLLIFMDNMWYQVAISFVMLAFYWIFMAMSLEKSAFSDARSDTFSYKKIIIAASFFIIPDVILILLDVFFGAPNENGLYKLMFRYFNAGYLNFIILLKDSVIFRIVVTLSYYPALCIIYSRGKFLKNKIDASIKESKE